MPTPSPGFGFEITVQTLQPILDSVGQNIATLLPIIVPLFGIIIAVGLIPKLLKKAAQSS